MPTYSYACTACDNAFDISQKFTDDALTTCPECGGRLRKVYGSVGVTFKGGGFYRTDSRVARGRLRRPHFLRISGPHHRQLTLKGRESNDGAT